MKGYVWQTAENEWGHAVVATALSVVDDTALVSKTILGELKDHLQELCTNKHAHRVLMQLLAPDSHRYLPPATLAMMHPPTKTMMVAANSGAAAAGGLGLEDDEVLEDEQLQDMDALHDGDDETADAVNEGVEDDEERGAAEAAAAAETGDMGGGTAAEASAAAAGGSGGPGTGNGSEHPKMVERQLGESKKAATARRRELLGSGPGSFAAALLSVCVGEAVQLLQTPAGADVLVEAAATELQPLVGADVEAWAEQFMGPGYVSERSIATENT
eukprot:gene10358-10516_t